MTRALAASFALCLAASPLFAASAKVSPKIDAAVKVFKVVSGDTAKLKIFCDMSKVMEHAGDNVSPAAKAQIAGYMKQLGQDFEMAWNAGDGLNNSSADGKAYNAAIDDLAGKCE